MLHLGLRIPEIPLPEWEALQEYAPIRVHRLCRRTLSFNYSLLSNLTLYGIFYTH